MDRPLAECLCLAPGMKCHGCCVNEYIWKLEKQRDILACEYLRRTWGAESPFTQNEVKGLVYGMFPDRQAYRDWKANKAKDEQ